jgi:hypothetical protein
LENVEVKVKFGNNSNFMTTGTGTAEDFLGHLPAMLKLGNEFKMFYFLLYRRALSFSTKSTFRG